MEKKPIMQAQDGELYDRPSRKQPTSNISEKLRSFYDSVREETIPDKFLDLLEKLDEVEHAATGSRKK
jgi:hypothetical protein